MRVSEALIASADGCFNVLWEELSVQIAMQALQFASRLSPCTSDVLPGAEARVTRVVRMIERRSTSGLSLRSLAREANLSPYHLLRIFKRLMGLTLHRYVLHMRLRETAIRLVRESTNVLDIALDCGFGDVSNFNRVFPSAFGASPQAYRRNRNHGGAGQFSYKLGT